MKKVSNILINGRTVRRIDLVIFLSIDSFEVSMYDISVLYGDSLRLSLQCAVNCVKRSP